MQWQAGRVWGNRRDDVSTSQPVPPMWLAEVKARRGLQNHPGIKNTWKGLLPSKDSYLFRWRNQRQKYTCSGTGDHFRCLPDEILWMQGGGSYVMMWWSIEIDDNTAIVLEIDYVCINIDDSICEQYFRMAQNPSSRMIMRNKSPGPQITSSNPSLV